MNLLVTGGAGYIGSHVVDLLVDQDHNVTVVDNLSTGHHAAVRPEARLVEADLLDLPTIMRLFAEEQFEAVFHFAGHILVGESMKNPWPYLRDNVIASANLLEAMTSNDVERFIFSSTAALFDEPGTVPVPDDETIRPGSPYGESKFQTERQLYWMERIYGLRSISLRYFNAAGAHPSGNIGEDHDPETHLIPLVLQAALGQREGITLFGTDYDTPDGTAIRDYIHVIDLAEAHLLALAALENGSSRAYNLGMQRGFSVRQVIDTAQQITQQPIRVVESQRRAGDLPVLIADSSRIRSELGWAPEFDSLEKIIETAWAWHQQHPDGYSD